MIESRVLLVDDEEELRHSSAQALELAGFRVDTFASAEHALEFIGFSFPGVVISDIRMPGMDGMTFLQRIREIDVEVPVILVTGHGDVQLAVRAMREGAYDFVEKPFTAQMLAGTIRRALDWRALVLENRRLKAVAGKRDDIEQRLPGRSQVMVDLRYRVRAIGASDADTLIIGDTGVGKEVVARTLHDLSGRANNPFIAINCAALPENLIESELFGHEPGAFPGAIRPRYGKFEHGRGGTILLDEIGSMPIDLQAKFLRVLQERVITRLGSNEVVPLDVRFIATNKVDLEQEVAAGRFRPDLLYRLNVATLRVPPLTQRRADIPLLFLQLVRESAARYGRDEVEVSQNLLAEMAERNWPGNVRELRNAAERLVLGLDTASNEINSSEPNSGRLADKVAAFEKGLIANAIATYGGALKPVYESLGISRKTLYEKMQKFGLDKKLVATDMSGESDGR
ncbi:MULTISPECIES: sigma-54 dependent transcriptional regulator [Ensifer]|jgi:two-component system, NtrC family, C4-dicarboxylate transport response regulator DctD|uniref:C4-dicarboxylate transport transcriptional regulatory protein DctD n=1 Tax=Ensifer canadensis TaxID=555315 RepID=A0AAW4FM62_9HYPH|nr:MULTISPECIES: sigma-54 dependent transcriptional regulator [Ensifer]AHK45686.1 two component, sigma54 specific, transcriptional regulator, Fis family [Ensifer adhaerens OV14]MDP9631695.1 two-component system C4-dicarboxylate transport response regulator DctD [Ensifer adhaerens]KQU72474.1 Fis family transcriptional regulator [Ensifer sp. Root31]KQW56716.1 Fis family transcriptional regulator [Ensifer sp. Root127]KQW60346.1 Fis family transcriptional regulator [Ensifer sp. Root1252]